MSKEKQILQYWGDGRSQRQTAASLEYLVTTLVTTLVTGTVKKMLQYYENITRDFRYDSLTLTPCICGCLTNFLENP